MRIRIALTTAVAVICIPIGLLLTVFSSSPSASAPTSGRHEANGQVRASHEVNRLRAEKTAKLAAFYKAVSESAWLTAVYNNQLAAFYQAINTQQEAAWLTAVYNNQLAAFYQAINTQQEAVWLTAVHNNQVAAYIQQQDAAWLTAVHNNQVAASEQAINQQHEAVAAAAPAPVRAPVPAPAPAPAASGGGWTGPWACIARYESGGNPAANTGNGFYGGLQFTLGTWQANGGTGNPANASIAQQEAVANNVLASQGWGAWPNTSRMCGL
jgi:hypothetical protein